MEMERKVYTILAAMIDVLTVRWRAPEGKYNYRAMITLYELKTKANARLANMAASNADADANADALLRGPLGILKWTRYGFPRCQHFSFSIQFAFLEVGKCDLRLLLFLNHTNILFISTWVSELHRN